MNTKSSIHLHWISKITWNHTRISATTASFRRTLH